MDPVVGEGVVVVLADEEEGPVVLAIATGRPPSHTIKLVVGDGHSASLAPAADDELTTSQGELQSQPRTRVEDAKWYIYLVVVNPHEIRVIKGNGISSPHILRVQVLILSVAATDASLHADIP